MSGELAWRDGPYLLGLLANLSWERRCSLNGPFLGEKAAASKTTTAPVVSPTCLKLYLLLCVPVLITFFYLLALLFII